MSRDLSPIERRAWQDEADFTTRAVRALAGHRVRMPRQVRARVDFLTWDVARSMDLGIDLPLTLEGTDR